MKMGIVSHSKILLLGYCLFCAGLVISPHAAEITFNRSDPADYNHYIKQLHELMQSEFSTTTCTATVPR